jgi:hypothetical protein
LQEEDSAIAKDKFLVQMALAPAEVKSIGDTALEQALNPKQLTQMWSLIPDTSMLQFKLRVQRRKSKLA